MLTAVRLCFHTRMAKSRRVSAALAFGLVVVGIPLAVGGCSTADRFATVDSVAADLDLGTLGQLQSQVHYGGSTGIVKESLPSVEAFLVPGATTSDDLELRLEGLGFTKVSAAAWTRSDPFTQVLIGAREANSSYSAPGKGPIAVPAAGGLVIVISSS